MRIFLSYRRQDLLVDGTVHRLREALARRFGAANVFVDREAIPPGRDFRRVLDESIGQSNVVLALIGPDWVKLQQARMDGPAEEDFVRVELESALRFKIAVVPVLFGGAPMPAENQLPPSIRAIAFHQAVEFDHAKRFEADTERLIAELCVHHGSRSEKAAYARKNHKPLWMSARFRGLAAIMLAALLLVGLYLDGRLWDAFATLRGLGPVSGLAAADYQLAFPEWDGSSREESASETKAIDRIRRQEMMQKAQASAADGQELMMEGDYEGAEKAFRRALDLLPDIADLADWRQRVFLYYGDAAFQLARLYEEEGRGSEALAYVEVILSEDIAPDLTAAKRLKKRLEGLELSDRDLEYLACDPHTREIEERLDRIILPAVEFTDTPLRDAIEFLRTRSSELDALEPDPVRRGVPMILDGVYGDAPITLRLQNVTLENALESTVIMAQVRFVIEPHAVLVVPFEDYEARMITRLYRLSVAQEKWAAKSAPEYGLGASWHDPFGTGTPPPYPPRTEGVEKWMNDFGILFPPGSSASYDAKKGVLRLHNTPGAHELLESVLEAVSAAG